jgi:Fe-S oxidoreductase
MISLALFLVITVVALGIFLHTLIIRLQVLLAARPTNGFDQISKRIKAVCVYAFGQKKFVVGEQPAGWMHFIIFWGFLILGLQIATMFGRAFSPHFAVPGFAPEQFGKLFLFLRDVMEVVVMVAASVGLYRWLISHPHRLSGFRPAESRLAAQSHWEGPVILVFIFTIMLSGLLYDGGRMVSLTSDPFVQSERPWEPMSALVGNWVAPLGADWAGRISLAAWWLHNLIVLTFLNLLPRSKHFHIITSIPNVFFRKVEPAGALSKMDLQDSEMYGASHIDQFTRKQVLDMYSCTECGRCSSHCPATASGKALAPRQMLLDLRDFLYKNQEAMVDKWREKKEGPVGENVVGETLIHDDVLWACTTCRACEEACPVMIEYVDKIVDMRRHLVQDKARFPAELIKAFNGMESQSNPWGIGAHKRVEWAQDLNVPLISEHPEAEYLYYVGCAGAFDDRNKKSTIAFVKILKTAGVSFAILGKDEPCNGDSARRLGNEYLYQNMAQHLVKVLNSHGVKKIIVNCPHCFNTLKNEYPQFGGHYEVISAAEMVSHLLNEGRLKLKEEGLAQSVTYHDSCYYGRYNEIYDLPREVLGRVPGVKVKEMERNRQSGMCCGAGGGWMWMEEPQDKRVSSLRVEQALQTDPNVVAVSCPFCMIMLTDGLKAKNADEKVQMRDVMELIESSMASES